MNERCLQCEAPFTERAGDAGTRTESSGSPGLCYVCHFFRSYGWRQYDVERACVRRNSVVNGECRLMGPIFGLVGEPEETLEHWGPFGLVRHYSPGVRAGTTTLAEQLRTEAYEHGARLRALNDGGDSQ